jgi:hypothetical protein
MVGLFSGDYQAQGVPVHFNHNAIYGLRLYLFPDAHMAWPPCLRRVAS